jgi:hypothetical protein
MPIPTAVGAINKASNKILKGTWFAQSKFDKTWLAVKVTVPSLWNFTSAGQVTYSYEYYKDGLNGEKTRSGTYGVDNLGIQLTTKGYEVAAVKGKVYKTVQTALLDHVTAVAEGTALDNYVNTDTPVLPDNRVNIGRWNPPNHSATRGLPFYVTAGIKSASPLSPSEEYLLATADKYSNNLGKIYQTTSSAKALNVKNVSKLKKTSGAYKVTPDKIWGFRFCYNPTTITYSTSVDSSIDWMLAPSDPSKFFGGNTSVTFDLYLNRIVDMSTLRRTNYQSSYPGIDLTDEQRQGILTRGTEYDIEYLYRVVNGNPKSGTKLLSDTTALTSDYGYITGMPFWLQLHDNMIFKASLSGFSVNHVMFTEKMVPMFTVVTLSFIRYPETNTTGDGLEAINNYIKTGFTS